MVNLRALFIAAGAFAAAFFAAAVTHTEEIPKRAPYHAVRWEANEPVVRIGSEWFDLLSIDGVTVGEIFAYCEETYGDNSRKRFEEDLVEVLLGMGHEIGATVRLVVRDRDDSEVRTLEDVAMTLENRQKIWRDANGGVFSQRMLDHPFPKRAPYNAVRWDESHPMAKIDGEWLALVSIDGVEVPEIVAYCRENYHAKWRKRFEEDLVEVMAGMDHDLGETVQLIVRGPDAAETRTLDGVAMTYENRQAIWYAAQSRRLRGVSPSVVSSDEAAE